MQALDFAEEFGDLKPLSELLTTEAQIPQWVMSHLGELMKKGIMICKRQKQNKLDERLIIAAFECNNFRRPGETRDQRIQRCAVANKVSEASLRNLLDGKGRAASRLRSWRKQNPTPKPANDPTA